MQKSNFPNLKPPAADSKDLRPPTLVRSEDKEWSMVFQGREGKTKYLLTEETAGCKHINMGLFLAEPGQGSMWHNHPQETEEEEYLYIMEGKGMMYYKQGGKNHGIQFKKGDAIFTGHLTHYVENIDNSPLLILFSIAPLPATTIFYNDKKFANVDSVNLNPPILVHPNDVEEVAFSKGGITNRRLLFPEKVGGKYGRLGYSLEKPGLGSTWHTHPLECEEEDLFYIETGKGTMFYLQGGREYSFEFKKGDAIHSHYLTNYTINTGTEDVYIPFVGAPNPAGTIVHEF